MDEEIRDNAAVERHAREWICRDAENTVREVTDSLFRCRDVRDARDAFARARAFVIRKEERAIAHDWTTDRAAKLVAQVFRFRLTRGSEEVSRVERGRSEERRVGKECR